ncbi:hypothetical protein [Dyadobacter sp. CY351]|uniref:hypothetical protein n=1 Tax=Dyadobacter sp. CY351 TaxID=2909337 RepID=UPI001F34FAE8|nr:hypothetical protein [Dyadobacter sp. CY351]MCF2521112.1 hypothetical protein [Dyadobacter sp. CY351]
MIKINQVNFEELSSLPEIDIFITALGYESRASHLAALLVATKARKKYCVQLVKNCNSFEKESFLGMNFQIIMREDFEVNSIFDFPVRNVVIDYSVMMKSLYAELIKFLVASNNFNETNFYFSYTQSEYEVVERQETQIQSIQPILTTKDKLMTIPKDGYKLVISLGHERLSAIGVIENLEIDYEDVYVLINKESSDAPYYMECMRSNKDFLSMLKRDQIIELDFFNFNQTISILDSIYYKLSLNGAQVILAPMSVKTFNLLSMIHSLRYNNVFFYNVTSLSTGSVGTKRADKSVAPIVYLVNNGDDVSEIF